MIGIVTPYKTPNYGTKLQAYAMQELMSEYDQAEILGFIPSSDMRLTSVIGKIVLKVIKKKRNIQNDINNQIRVSALNSFNKEYRFGEEIKGNTNLKRKIKKYDAIVCGSDQLWAPTNVIADYFTLSIVPRDINTLSYAASFGVAYIPNYLRHRYKRFLNRLNNIAVREIDGVKLVKELSGRDAELVLDPTLMIGSGKWRELAQEAHISIEMPYMFCYFLGEDVKHREIAKEIASKRNLKIVTFPHLKKYVFVDDGFGDFNFYDATPIDFLSLVQKASFVCTDSFHGTAFSILFKRDFYVFERFGKDSKESTNNRIYSLLEMLCLNNRLIGNNEETRSDFLKDIDYSIAYDRLLCNRQKSFQYLDKALNMTRKAAKNDTN